MAAPFGARPACTRSPPQPPGALRPPGTQPPRAKVPTVAEASASPVRAAGADGIRSPDGRAEGTPPRATEAAMPPGPRLPRWLQTLGFIFIPVRFIEACRRRYGDLVTFRSLMDPGFVMVFEPELVKQVFRG